MNVEKKKYKIIVVMIIEKYKIIAVMNVETKENTK